MNPLSNKLVWTYQKNKHLIDSIVLRKAPQFVYSARPREIDDDIPVFTFHVTMPELFEQQCLHLVENGYRTLTSDEFLWRLTNQPTDKQKCVLITFDDGIKHVWSVAYPLLKKYGLHATCFLIPGCISETDDSVRPTMENVWQGDAEVAEVVGMKHDEAPLATWAEIKLMHESGVINFESHTMHHAVVPVSDEITTFVHPGYDPHFYGNVMIPLYTKDGVDVVDRTPLLGMPIYRAQPRMQAESRYFDDEGLRQFCTEFVIEHGGSDFFTQKNWENLLRNVTNDYKNSNMLNVRYETAGERDKVLFDELLMAKEVIEGKLGDKKVNHLCYPWYNAESFAVDASRRAGYLVNHFGQREGRISNLPGQDPFNVVRVEDIFMQRLPGKNRKSLWDLFNIMLDLRALPSHMFPEGKPLVGQTTP